MSEYYVIKLKCVMLSALSMMHQFSVREIHFP